jgi:hypothetical protein
MKKLPIDEYDYPLLKNSGLGTFELDSIHIMPILFQMGYLTIRDYNEVRRTYLLDYPNAEVRKLFSKYLVESLKDKKSWHANGSAMALWK